jgi:hypothetical protein
MLAGTLMFVGELSVREKFSGEIQFPVYTFIAIVSIRREPNEKS